MSTETALQLKNTLKKMGLKFQNPKLMIFFKDYIQYILLQAQSCTIIVSLFLKRKAAAV